MRINWNLKLIGSRVELVPYRKKFVDQYHEWMKDPYLIEMTASEPLTIDEEYEMQRCWTYDSKKCTFIILRKEQDILATSTESDEIQRMIGDVNLFLQHDPDFIGKTAEVDIMIAESMYRNQGYGSEALALMIIYGYQKLGIRKFLSKISLNNNQSQKLFERFGFICVKYVEIFKEYEYKLELPQDFDISYLPKEFQNYTLNEDLYTTIDVEDSNP